MRITIIANPAAGGGRPYRKIRNYIRSWKHADWDVELLTTQNAGHAGHMARELRTRSMDVLAVCGGDGTVNEVASSLPDPPFPIAILPGGTANVLARELRLPLDPVRSLEIALQKKIRRVDLGSVEGNGCRRFVFVAGVGFDAFAVHEARSALKARVGMAAYAVAILECLRGYTFPEFHVSLNGRTFSATSCLACNCRRYGGGLLFCPDADMADGLLDVLVIEGVHRIGLARFLLAAWLGIVQQPAWVHRMRAKSLEMDGPATVRVQTDGELAGSLPVRIGLAEKAFPLVVP